MVISIQSKYNSARSGPQRGARSGVRPNPLSTPDQPSKAIKLIAQQGAQSVRNTGRLGTCNLHLVRGPVVKSNISEYDPEGMAIQFTKELENQLSSMRAEFRIKQKQVKEMVQPPRDPSNQGKVRKLEAEVFRRDKILDQLNEKIVSMESKAGNSSNSILKTKEKMLVKMRQEIEFIYKDKEKVIEQTTELRKTILENKAVWENSKDTVETMEQAYKPEIQELQRLVQAKESQSGQSGQDLQKLVQIIEEMKKLNSDLNSKITILDQRIEQSNAENLDLQVKLFVSDGIEQKLIEVSDQNADLYEKLEKARNDLYEYEEIVHRIKSMMNIQIQYIDGVQSRLNYGISISEALKSEIPGDTKTIQMLDDLVNKFEDLIHELNKARNVLNQELQRQLDPQKRDESEGAILSKIKEAESQIIETEMDFKRAKIENETLTKKMQELKQKYDQMKQFEEQEQQAIQQRFEDVNHEVQLIKDERNRLEQWAKDKKQQAEEAERTTQQLMQENDQLKDQMIQLDEKNTELENQLQKLRKDLYIITNGKKDVDFLSNQRKQQIKLGGLRIGAMENELLRKDREIAERDQQIVDLEASIEEARKHMAQVVSRRR